MSLFQDTADMLFGTNVVERQNLQWQQANDNLLDAQAAMRALTESDWYPSEDHPEAAAQVAIAHALIGLLADRLSRR